ncbi:MAG: NAD(P)/FAD-dependent oxidoreductase [Myxococcales bacterium]|nr:NAD(P)/FAD-dependent oxidoreductase [Myxococcales bacterium]
MSGICMAVQLKKRGIHDFVILEKAEAVGGTWRENTYPGVACDVPSHLYSYSFELNPNWSHSYSTGRDIWDYCEAVVQKHDLKPHIRFGAEISNVRFDGSRWQIEVKDGATVDAEIVVSGMGGLHVPNRAALPGMDSFAGTSFHTAEWNHDHDLTGRRVAIIGTGASAVQVLPAIAEQVAEVSIFQRSAAWVFPRLAREIPEDWRARFRRAPLLLRLYRWCLWMFMDVFGFLSLRRGSWMAAKVRRIGLAHLEAAVKDPVLRQKLTPDYNPGCKRRCIADDYWITFNRDNVHLVVDTIASVEAGGIRDASGKLHEVDTIIEATGFRPFDISDYVNIEGRDGRRLRDVWGERIETFRTMMIPGFPNFFLLLGPNSGTGHTSALIMIESQVQYILRCLRLMEREGVKHLDPDPEVVRQYNRRLQRDMKGMVFSGGCNAWYTDANDYNFTLWPYSAVRFVAELKRIKRSEFLSSADLRT